MMKEVEVEVEFKAETGYQNMGAFMKWLERLNVLSLRSEEGRWSSLTGAGRREHEESRRQ